MTGVRSAVHALFCTVEHRSPLQDSTSKFMSRSSSLAHVHNRILSHAAWRTPHGSNGHKQSKKLKAFNSVMLILARIAQAKQSLTATGISLVCLPMLTDLMDWVNMPKHPLTRMSVHSASRRYPPIDETRGCHCGRSAPLQRKSGNYRSVVAPIMTHIKHHSTSRIVTVECERSVLSTTRARPTRRQPSGQTRSRCRRSLDVRFLQPSIDCNQLSVVDVATR